MKRIEYNIKFKFLLGLVFILTQVSCKKFVEIDSPNGAIVGGEIFNTSGGASGVLTGIFYSMSSGEFVNGESGLSVLCGLSSDELIPFNLSNETMLSRLYKNNLSALTLTPQCWNQLYSFIFRANAAIEGISANSNLNYDVKKRLLGEAYFIRAFCNFYLVNLYGNVPLLLTTDYKVTSIADRTSEELVYNQIVIDLHSAQDLLGEDYVKASDITQKTEDRFRPNKSTATALLARVFLFRGDWKNAELESTKVIENTKYKLLDDLSLVFLKNSEEAIWQLQPIDETVNATDGKVFIPLLPSTPSVYLSDDFLTILDDGDRRKTTWIGKFSDGTKSYNYAFKYKLRLNPDNSECIMMFRLAEQYLIRAEARIKQNKLTGINSGESDLNMIRNRAGVDNTLSGNLPDLLDNILIERQRELFSEWGHRWFDLKRTKNVDGVMSTVAIKKGTVWNSFKQLFPIPQEDINRNPSLAGKQNIGY